MIALDIPPQTSINAAADQYAEICLQKSSGIPRFADISFGPAPEQRLDIYLPAGGPRHYSGLPIFMFWHGGGHTHGHKEWCGFMAPPITANHAIFISANYRLVPRVSIEMQMDDARSAVKWVLDNIQDYGGDPRRLVIGGHSAGANIVTRLEMDAPRRHAHGIADGSITAVLPMSGDYSSRLSARFSEAIAQVPADEPDCAQDFEHPSTARFVLAWGSEERAPFPQEGTNYAALLSRQGLRVRTIAFKGEDHFSVHLATADADNAYQRTVAEELMRSR